MFLHIFKFNLSDFIFWLGFHGFYVDQDFIQAPFGWTSPKLRNFPPSRFGLVYSSIKNPVIAVIISSVNIQV